MESVLEKQSALSTLDKNNLQDKINNLKNYLNPKPSDSAPKEVEAEIEHEEKKVIVSDDLTTDTSASVIRTEEEQLSEKDFTEEELKVLEGLQAVFNECKNMVEKTVETLTNSTEFLEGIEDEINKLQQF